MTEDTTLELVELGLVSEDTNGFNGEVGEGGIELP